MYSLVVVIGSVFKDIFICTGVNYGCSQRIYIIIVFIKLDKAFHVGRIIMKLSLKEIFFFICFKDGSIWAKLYARWDYFFLQIQRALCLKPGVQVDKYLSLYVWRLLGGGKSLGGVQGPYINKLSLCHIMAVFPCFLKELKCKQ